MSSGARRLNLTLAGLGLWALHFGLVYGVTGLVCANRVPASIAGQAMPGAFVIPATGVALAVELALLVAALRIADAADPPPDDRPRAGAPFWRVVAGGSVLFGAVGILWTGIGAVFFPNC
jgi:hypothetical protein